jgi:hypothetical protein
MKSRSAFVKYWETRQRVISQVLAGLAGKQFDWTYSSGATDAWRSVANGLGIHLITLSAADKLRLELKRGQQPVGRITFGAPINRDVYVYVQECQFNPKKKKAN